MLGFSVNFKPGKSELTPSCSYTHLGCRFSTRDKMFRLPSSRCRKLTNVIGNLLAETKESSRPRALSVAAVIGSLWSINVVARTSTAILCRFMTLTIAKLLRVPELRIADPGALARMLKRVWRGRVQWTQAAAEELAFWVAVDFATLEAPMDYDMFDDAVGQVCLHPEQGILDKSVLCIGVDTSDVASGGGQFIIKGDLWCLGPDGLLHALLSEAEVDASSTMRELLGVLRAIEACAKNTTRVLVMCDNMAVSHIMRKGSKLPQLQAVVVRIFKLQLRRRMMVRCQWLRRDERILAVADAASRIEGSCEWYAPPLLFWRANQLSYQVWGHGLTFDRFATTRLSQPMDCGERLPFNSRFRQPHSSGVDAFQQCWKNHINWINAPFSLLDRVFDKLLQQDAVAVVVVPLKYSKRWTIRVRQGAMGLLKLWPFNSNLPAWRMIGMHEEAPPYRAGFALALVDYRCSNEAVNVHRDASSLMHTRGHRLKWETPERLETLWRNTSRA